MPPTTAFHRVWGVSSCCCLSFSCFASTAWHGPSQGAAGCGSTRILSSPPLRISVHAASIAQDTTLGCLSLLASDPRAAHEELPMQ